MDSSTILLTIAGAVLAGWLVLFVLQAVSLGTSTYDARTIKDGRVVGRKDRRTITTLMWSIPAVAGLGVLLAFGVDVAARMVFDWNLASWGAGLLVLLVTIALIAGLGFVWAMIRPEKPSYATIRTDIEDEAADRIPPARIDEFRADLAAVDQRVGYLRTHPNLSVTRFLWTRSWLRLVPVLVALIPLAALKVLMFTTGQWGQWWLLLVALVPPALSYLLAWATARASLQAKAAWRAVYAVQRAEVEQLLAEAQKNSRKRVAGLGDRVSRALQILREQQG